MPDNVILNKGLESKLSSIPIQNGSITVTEDGQNLYVDFRNGVRTKITDVVILTSSTSEVDTPVNGKFYYVNSTKALYLYNNGFNPLVNPNDSGYVVITDGGASNAFTFSDDGKTCTSANDLVGNIYPDMKKGTIVIDPVGNVGLFKSYSSSSDTATLDVLVDNRATTTITGYEVYIDTNYEGTGYGTYEKPFNTWAVMEAKCLTDLKNASKPYTIYLKSGSNVTDLTEIDGYNNVVIAGEDNKVAIIGQQSQSMNITNTNYLNFKNINLNYISMTIGENDDETKSDDYVTFNNCDLGLCDVVLQAIENCTFNNCNLAGINIVGATSLVYRRIIFNNCKNGNITTNFVEGYISLYNCTDFDISNSSASNTGVSYKIINTTLGTIMLNLTNNNSDCSFISGSYTGGDAITLTPSTSTGKIYLGTFDFNGYLPELPASALIDNPGLTSLQVYDNNNRTYLPTGGNLKEHLDAIGNKFSSLDTITGDLEELVDTIQNAYKDENTFNLETEITGEHRTGDVWKYTGTNNLTLTSAITETVQVDSSTGSGSTTTTPQFTFPNAKYFLKIGDQIKVGTTSTMIEVTNMQGDLITGSVGTAINTGEQSLSFDNSLELNTGDRIIWIGNTWDKLSGTGASDIIDLGTVDMPLDPRNPEAGGSNEVLADVTNQGIYKYNYDSPGGTSNEYLIVTRDDVAITQVRFADGYIYTRLSSADELSITNWTYYAHIGDVNNLKNDIDALDTRVTNAETKLSTVYKYKGSSTVANLPTANQETGDVYNLTDGGTINSGGNEETVVVGDNVAWDGTKWDKLAGTIDVEPSISEYDTVITSQEEWDTMVASPTWNNAKKVLINSDSIIYIDNNTPDGDQYSMTVPSNVVEIYVTKNGLGNKNNHSEALHSNCSIIYEPGCTKFVNNPQNGYMIKNAQCEPENFRYIVNCTGSQLVEGHIAIGCEYESYINIKYILDCNITSSTEIDDCGFIENTGRLSELTTTTKTDLVSAINELKTNISDSAIVNLGILSGSPDSNSELLKDTTSTGIYKYSYTVVGTTFNEYMIVSGSSGTVSNIYQTRFSSTDNNIKVRSIRSGTASNWFTIDSYHDVSTGDVTIGGKVNTTGTRDAGNVVIGSGTTTTGDNGVVIGSVAEVTGANNKNAIAIGYEAVSAANGAIQIGHGTNSTANTTQIGEYPLLDATGKIVEDRLPDGASEIIDLGLVEGDLTDDMGGIDSSFLDVTTAGIYKFSIKNNGNETVDGYLIVSNNTTVMDEFDQWLFVPGSLQHRSASAGEFGDWGVYVTRDVVGSYSKKYSTIVIGNSASGLTANDVDYLYTVGSDFTTTLTNAINALPSIGGEIKILGGIYTLSTPVEVSSIGLKPIKITGEGKSTVITSDTPTDHYITACSCEISECRLETDIRIKPSGYVNIHDCEIAERIYISNTSTLYNIFIHDNNLDYTATEKDFLYLSGSGGIYNFQVYNNYSYTNISFDFLYVAAPTTVYSSSIRNNHCPYGTWNSSTYSLHSNSTPHRKSTMTGNTFNMINFRGNYWCISNNHITYYLYLYGGNYLDVMNNRVDGTFTAASGLTYTNITGNIINSIATTSPYVNLGTYSRFANNTIRDTAFNTTYLPGHDTASNKWGNNMWANGFDRLVFANEEEIGGQ